MEVAPVGLGPGDELLGGGGTGGKVGTVNKVCSPALLRQCWLGSV